MSMSAKGWARRASRVRNGEEPRVAVPLTAFRLALSCLPWQGSALTHEDAMAAHEDAGKDQHDGDEAYERP